MLADNVPAVIGMTIYVEHDGKIESRTITHIRSDGKVFEYDPPTGTYYKCRTAYAYSSLEAAEAGYRKDGIL